MDSVRVTGEQHREGEQTPWRVEVHVRGGARRVAFSQLASADTTVMLAACVVDDVPRFLTAHGAQRGALLLGAAADRLPTLVGPAALDAAGIERARPLLSLLADGLYTLEVRPVALEDPRAGFVVGGTGVELLGASPLGTPVALAVDHSTLLLGGGAEAARGVPALVISADVILDAPGFVAHEHDRGTREAFARSSANVLEDRALRDAVALHRDRYPTAPLGPFALAALEPAGDLARALMVDLSIEDVVDATSEIVRVAGPRTELIGRVRARTLLFEIAFVTGDGRRIDEVLVRVNGRLRATGVRPAARAIARVLRQLADEGA